MVVTKDSIIGEILAVDMGAAQAFFECGMFCVGCPSSAVESIEEASAVHGINCDELVDRLNAYFAEH
ncbi:MAG: DUF1858 domain-containing protein [Clostridia bacterium]|nr:DUF1858 domain-containing protein [Clostridia bacterium]